MKSILRFIYVYAAIGINISAFSQNGSVGIGTTTPHASAALEVQSTDKGVLIPRMTEAQRNSIDNPERGLLAYQTDNRPGFYVNMGLPAFPRWRPVSGPQDAFMASIIPSTQSIAPSDDFNIVEFDRIDTPGGINDGNLFDPVTHQFVANRVGLYFFRTGVNIQNAGAGTYALALDKDTASISVYAFDQKTTGAVSLLLLKVSDIMWLEPGEVVIVTVKHNALSNQKINNSVGTYFQGFRIY